MTRTGAAGEVSPCRLRRVGLTLVGAILLAGCASQREIGLPVVYGARVNVDPQAPVASREGPDGEPEGPQDAGYWQPVADDFVSGAAQVAPVPDAVAVSTPRRRLAARARAATRAVRRIPEPPTTVLVPRQRARKEARPKGEKTGKTAAQLASDHYLDYPTHIKAKKITFACPPSYNSRVRLRAQQVDRSRPERVRAEGAARLVIGELTLEAERITWRVQPEGKLDIQILAHGDVHLISHVRGNVQRETGIRGLVITNDRVVPLR